MTQRAMQSLANQTHRPDIILWDNNSSDGSKQVLSGITFGSNVTKVMSDKNVLWTPAINQAIETYGKDYEFIGFMNNDIILPNNAIEEMIKTASIPSVGMVGPVGIRLGGPQDYVVNINRWKEAGRSLDDYPKQISHRVTYLVGACIVMRKSVWDATGGLDNDMALGADDHYQSIMVKDAGYEIRVQDNTVADHVGHASGASIEWQRHGGPSWAAFNKKVDLYYRSEREALLCHWNGVYHPGWEVGTGWMTDDQRDAIYEYRRVFHEQNKNISEYSKDYKSDIWNGGY